MRLNTSTQTLFVVSSLFCFGSSLPFLSRRAPVLVPLVRRATYSVVPVDGGPTATDDGSPGATIVKTIIQTPAPVTLPPVTNVVVSTKIIEGPKSTQTVLVTITQTPVAATATTTATKYSIIDVSPPPVTVVIPAPAASNAASRASKPDAVPTPSTVSIIIATSSGSSGEPTSTKATPITSTSTSVSTSVSNVATPPPGASTSSPSSGSSAIVTSLPPGQPTSIQTSASTAIASTSTLSYDNGQWHTYYPTWSNATGTPTGLTSVPTLKARLDSAGAGVANHGLMAAFKQLIS